MSRHLVRASGAISEAVANHDDLRERADAIRLEWRRLRELGDFTAADRKFAEFERLHVQLTKARSAVHTTHANHAEATVLHREELTAEREQLEERIRLRRKAHES